MKEIIKIIIYVIGSLIGIGVLIVMGLIMFKVIPVPEGLWGLVVIRG